MTCTHCNAPLGLLARMLDRRQCGACRATVGPSLKRWEAFIDDAISDRVLTNDEELRIDARAVELGLTAADQELLRPKLDRARAISWALTGRPVARAVGIKLRAGEQGLFHTPATLHEERTSRRYVSGSRGVSIRIAKGVSYRVGASRGYSVPVTEVVAVCDGTFTITNRRCVFTGPRKTVAVDLDDLVAFSPFDDGIQLHHEGSKKLQVFQFPDGEYAAAVLSGLMTPASPETLSTSTSAGGAPPTPRRSATRGGLKLAIGAGVVTAVAAAVAGSDKTSPSSSSGPASGTVRTPEVAVAAAAPTMPVAPVVDEVADLMALCGRPTRDFVAVEGGQNVRHLVYKKANVELKYVSEPGAAWRLVGRSYANKDELLSKRQIDRKLPCSKETLRIPDENERVVP